MHSVDHGSIYSLFAGINNRKYLKTFLVLLFVWFAVNLVQAVFMEILSDEAYYKLYSEHLDWGYYDHPPMIALMIKASSLIFSGNLGIRFLTLLLQPAALILIWMTLEKKEPDSRNVYTFFIISGSILMFSGYGVITAPDSPLLFFTALFLFSYKKFINSKKWPFTMLLSVAMAAMVYSKYQAVPVIGFVIISNIRLLKSFKFWIAGIFAAILLTPHFYWQYLHDFPSLQYHLAYRLEDFKLKHVLEYLPNQLAMLNPFTCGAAAYVLIKFFPSGHFNRSLYFQIIGFIVFFLIISIRDHVEPNWTVTCSIPIIIILSEKSAVHQGLFRYIRRFILPSVMLVLAVRIFLMTRNDFTRSIGYSGKEEKYKCIESVAKDLPVVFLGSYEAPSLYHFFTGKEGMVLSSLYSRQTQFDIWQLEKKYHNKPVFICSFGEGKGQCYGTGCQQFYGYKTDSLQTVNRIKIAYKLEKDRFQPGDTIRLTFMMQNNCDYSIDFNHHLFPAGICLLLIKEKNIDQKIILDVSLSKPLHIIKEGQTLERSLTTVVPDMEAGHYKLGICLTNAFGPSFNSRFNQIHISNGY